jgi:hypothetical protein
VSWSPDERSATRYELDLAEDRVAEQIAAITPLRAA